MSANERPSCLLRVTAEATACGPSCAAAAPSASELWSACRPCTRRPHRCSAPHGRETRGRARAAQESLPDTVWRHGFRSHGRRTWDTAPAAGRRVFRPPARAAVGGLSDHTLVRLSDPAVGVRLQRLANGAACRYPARRAASSCCFSRAFSRRNRSCSRSSRSTSCRSRPISRSFSVSVSCGPSAGVGRSARVGTRQLCQIFAASTRTK